MLNFQEEAAKLLRGHERDSTHCDCEWEGAGPISWSEHVATLLTDLHRRYVVETLEKMPRTAECIGSSISEFCKYCGAGVDKFRREGEGTCPECDPPLTERKMLEFLLDHCYNIPTDWRKRILKIRGRK